jgi:hypothetical protein
MTPTLTAQEARALIQRFNDHDLFCSHLKIRDKAGVAVEYRNSAAGRKLHASIRKQERKGQPVRQVVLKASQVWMSSSAATEVFRRVPFFPGRRALVVADSQTHADLVFEYYTQYIQSYGDHPYGSEMGARIELPALVKDTDQWLRWANGSSILVGTANNVEIGRSAPYNWAQLSEAAFYRSLGALMTGLMQRVPNSTDSGVIVESTPDGEGGDFYDLCQLAMSGKSGWAFVFFGWWEHPENATPPSRLGYADDAAFQRSLLGSEIEERDKYNLNLPQLAWRRYTLETACEGRLERFRQEHAGNPQEAFQGSGRTIFDLAAIARLPVVQNPVKGRLEVVTVGLEKRPMFIQAEDRRGEVSMFRLPEPGRNYVLGADHAEGIDPGAKKGRSDPDYCSATMFDADSGEEVCKIKERYEARPWAERLYWLCRMYNWAFIVPEQKAQGKAVIGHLLAIEGGYPLELIYSAERDPSDRRPALLQELGYDTNTILRPVLVSAIDTALREGAIRIHDPETILQLRQFVRKPNGREEGIRHDDDVLGVGLALVGLAKARRAFAYREQQRKLAGKQWSVTNYRLGGRQPSDDDD